MNNHLNYNNLNNYAMLMTIEIFLFIMFMVFFRHYKQSYQYLMEQRLTDINNLEIKVCAGFLNYKVGVKVSFYFRLYLTLNLNLKIVILYRATTVNNRSQRHSRDISFS